MLVVGFCIVCSVVGWWFVAEITDEKTKIICVNKMEHLVVAFFTNLLNHDINREKTEQLHQ